MNVKAIIHDAEAGGFWAEIPALPGCVTQGDSIDEVTANLREAIHGWVAVDVSTEDVQPGARVMEFAR